MLDPYSAEAIEDPISFWKRLRGEAPVFEVPGSAGHFLVSRYCDVRSVCGDPDTYSNELLANVQRGEDGRPRLVTFPSKDLPHGRVLGTTDGAIHRRHRGLLARAFSARRMKDFEAWLQGRAHSLLEAAGAEFDAMASLAAPLPAQAMAHLLGLPPQDWKQLLAWSDSVMKLMGGLASPDELQVVFGDVQALEAYLRARLEEASTDSVAGDPHDVLHVVSVALARGEIESWEAGGLLFQLVVGGSDTTVGLIGAAIRRLAEDPARAEVLRRNREEVAAFLEETLRLDGPAIGNYRRTTIPCALNGVAIPEGSTLTLLWGSANRDESEFSDAERFDPKRSNLKSHLGFGTGSHFCLGAALARMEARTALEALLDRPGTTELACRSDDLRAAPSLFIRKLSRLPIHIAGP